MKMEYEWRQFIVSDVRCITLPPDVDDGLEHLQWAKEFLKKFDKKYGKRPRP